MSPEVSQQDTEADKATTIATSVKTDLYFEDAPFNCVADFTFSLYFKNKTGNKLKKKDQKVNR